MALRKFTRHTKIRHIFSHKCNELQVLWTKLSCTLFRKSVVNTRNTSFYYFEAFTLLRWNLSKTKSKGRKTGGRISQLKVTAGRYLQSLLQVWSYCGKPFLKGSSSPFPPQCFWGRRQESEHCPPAPAEFCHEFPTLSPLPAPQTSSHGSPCFINPYD